MLFDARQTLQALLQSHEWLPELFSILPLSALLDFVDTGGKLHILQLVGTVPIWSWPVTPAGSRILLADESADRLHDDADDPFAPCHLDGFGERLQLNATDGRYGDHYVIPSPETLRLCLAASPSRPLVNKHENMQGTNERLQHLEVVRVTKLNSSGLSKRASPRRSYTNGGPFMGFLLDSWRCESTLRYVVVSTLGWLLMIASLTITIMLRYHLGAAFLASVCLTGLCVQLLHGCAPRRLLRGDPSGYDRMIVVSEYSNTRSWKVFYGDSSIINSLLNLPLRSDRLVRSPYCRRVLRMLLRGLILAQWACAIGVAAKKDWGALFVCAWVSISIVTHAYLLPPTTGAQLWMRSHAGISFQRHQVQLGSRRSLLSALMALNPDTPPLSADSETEVAVNASPMAWIDPILKDGPPRRRWEEAMRKAITETFSRFYFRDVASDGHKDAFFETSELTWFRKYDGSATQDYKNKDGSLAQALPKPDYWLTCIYEGLYVAAMIKAEWEPALTKI